MARRIACAACIVLLADSIPAVGLAQTGAAPRSHPVVELIVIGGGSDAVVLIGTVDQLLGGVGVATESHAVSAPSDVSAITRGAAAARVQVDLRDPQDVVLVTEGHGGTSTSKRLRRDPSAAVTREEVAQAIESAVEAEILAQSGEAGKTSDVVGGAPAASSPAAAPASTPAAAPPPATVPAAPQPAAPAWSPPMTTDRVAAPQGRTPLSVDVSALAGAGWFAGGIGPLPELEAQLALTWQSRWRPTIILAGLGIAPFDASNDSLTAHASVLGSRLFVRLDVARSSWLALSPGLGAGVDFLSVRPESSVVADSALHPSTTHADGVVSGFIAARAALVDRLSLDVLFGADVDVAPPRYIADGSGNGEAVFSPWRARPVLFVGLTFALGAPDFEPAGVRR